ncbi:MAG: hypothetical protein IT494_05970 [Gammaproteobacteria bacterium]|nr:hypothetical protein [Gammaproteobacteria bacterium]
MVGRSVVGGHSGTPTDSSTRLDFSKALIARLLRLYDSPDPHRAGRMIRGYDRDHALRTARLCRAVAVRLGCTGDRLRDYQIACLLHDLGRTGLERELFGRIWSWARTQGIPTRPREWRTLHPATVPGRETEAFIAMHGADLAATGISLDARTFEQIEMRLGYARRLARRLREVRPALTDLGIEFRPWMARVMLYYYYPERLAGAAPWVRRFAEILVACEQFEAYNNRQRGGDYYVRRKETVADAFAYLDTLHVAGVLGAPVVNVVRELAAAGVFDELLAEARGQALTKAERRALRTQPHEVTT